MTPLALLAGMLVVLLLPAVLLPRLVERSELVGWLRPMKWLGHLYVAAWHRLETEVAPLPDEGPAILVSNHTCGVDHLMLQAGCRRVLGFLIAREIYNWAWLKPFCELVRCIPVDRSGRDLSATRAALRALDQGRVVTIFPEGRITPASGRRFGPARPGAAFLALRTGTRVYPAFIYGTPPTSSIPWSLLTPSRARVVYGPTVDLSDLHSHRPDHAALAEANDRIMRAIRDLRERAIRDDPTWWSAHPPESERVDDDGRGEGHPVALSGAVAADVDA